MPVVKDNKKLVAITTITAIVCGLALAGLLMWSTGRGGGSTAYKPFNAGYEKALRKNLEKGGPVYFADPFGGNQGFWFALEDGEIVALAVNQPDQPKCSVRWRGSRNTFVDCNDQPRAVSALARFGVEIKGEVPEQLVFVDLQALLPPPSSVPPPVGR